MWLVFCLAESLLVLIASYELIETMLELQLHKLNALKLN